MILDQVVSDTHNDIGAAETDTDVVVRLQAGAGQRSAIAKRYDTLCHKGIGDRYIELFGKFSKVLPGATAHHTVTGKDHWITRFGNQRGGTLYLLLRWLRRKRPVNRQRSRRHW